MKKKLRNCRGKVKFPVRDEDISRFDKKGKPLVPIPPPKGVILLPLELVPEALSVWEFLNSFRKQLHLSTQRIEDFVDLIRYTKKPSVGLADVFLAPMKMILTDPKLCHTMSISVPKKMNFSRQLSSAMAKIQSLQSISGIISAPALSATEDLIAGFQSAVDTDFDTAYTGLKLLPTRLGPALLDGLRLPGCSEVRQAPRTH